MNKCLSVKGTFVPCLVDILPFYDAICQVLQAGSGSMFNITLSTHYTVGQVIFVRLKFRLFKNQDFHEFNLCIDPLHVTSRNNFNIRSAILEDDWSMKAMESKWKILFFELTKAAASNFEVKINCASY